MMVINNAEFGGWHVHCQADPTPDHTSFRLALDAVAS